MNLKPLVLLPLSLALAGLGGCWDAESPKTSSSTETGPMDFSTFTMALITGQTCDTTLPADVNSVDFTFAADQDTAEPVDVSSLTPGCTNAGT